MVPRVRFWILVLALVPVVVPRLAGQEPRFADAPIVPNRTGEQARGCCALRRGEISGRGVTLRQLIEAAHRRHPFDRREVIGGPWLDEGRYDFRAQVAGGHVYDRSGFPGQTFAMLRSYLANKARVRAEMRERSVYLLTVKDANALGPRLGRSDRDCGGDMRARERGEPIAGAPCGASPYPGRIAARGIGMPDLAALITPWVDQPVVDRTGLGGLFDVDLEGVEVRPAGPFGPSYRPSDTTRSLFEMLPEQLGLQLEPATAAIEVLVVEPIAKPAAPVDAIQGIISTPTRFPGSWRASGRDRPNSLTRACGSSATAATRTDFAKLGSGPNLAFR